MKPIFKNWLHFIDKQKNRNMTQILSPKIISNCETIEFELVPGKKRHFFTQVSDLLKGKKIVDIVIPGTSMSMTPNGLENNPANGFLTLVIDGREKVKNMPSTLMIESNKEAHAYYDDVVVEWSKSYFDLCDVPESSGRGIVFSIFFKD